MTSPLLAPSRVISSPNATSPQIVSYHIKAHLMSSLVTCIVPSLLSSSQFTSSHHISPLVAPSHLIPYHLNLFCRSSIVLSCPISPISSHIYNVLASFYFYHSNLVQLLRSPHSKNFPLPLLSSPMLCSALPCHALLHWTALVCTILYSTPKFQ